MQRAYAKVSLPPAAANVGGTTTEYYNIWNPPATPAL